MDATMRLALLVAIFIGSVNSACPPNFVASVTIPGKCYYIATTYTTFFSAINYCRNNLIYGVDILSIANGSENSEVASLLQSRGAGNGAWVGNAFYDNKPHWITTAAGNSSYSNWGSGIYNGNAAVITPSGSWSATYSGSSYGIVCEIYPDDPTTFPPPQITCPTGWTPSISVRGKCYQLIGKTDFFSAIENCLTTEVGDSHAELLTLTSQLEMMEIEHSWTSMTNLEEDSAWHWIETLHPTDYFGPDGSPTPQGGNCAYLDAYELYGGPCSNTRPTACQYFSYEPPTSPPPTTPSTPSPTTQPPSSCANGGTLVTGTDCSIPVCMNNGTVRSSVDCECSAGFVGSHCENVYCTDNAPDFLTESKSLVVVVRNTASMAQYINSISQVVQNEVTNFQNSNQDAYRSYLLVTVANGVFTHQLYYNFNDFNSSLSSLSSSTVGNCTESMFSALQAAFNEPIYNKSLFYIFTDAPVADLDQWRGVIEGSAVRKLPLFVFFVSTPQFQACNIDTLDPGYRTFSDVTTYTGGLFFTPSSDIKKFNQLFTYTIRATTYRVNQVLMDDLLKCSSYNERAVFTDSSTQSIRILATGTNMQVSLIDSRGRNVSVTTVLQDGTNYIYEADWVYSGVQYWLTISGATNLPCSYRVLEQSDYDLSVAVTTSLNLEATGTDPIIGVPTHIVAHLTGLQKAIVDPFRLFAELTITTNAPDGSSVHDPLFYSNALYRSGCGYQLYFGSAAFCREPYLRFYVTVYADDAYGFTIQRTVPGYCTASGTTVVPSNT